MGSIKEILKDFESFNFPLFSDIIYIVGIQGEVNFIPIYIGESTRYLGRMGDYISAQFNTPTDFKVGEAVKYIQSKGFPVGVKFKATKNRREDEIKYLNDIRTLGFKLLNDLSSFDYRTSNSDAEREKVQRFVQKEILDPVNP